MPWTEPQWSGEDLCPCAPMRSQTWARTSVSECSRAKMAPRSTSLLCDSPEILACDMASICVTWEEAERSIYAFQKVLAHLSYPATHLHLYRTCLEHQHKRFSSSTTVTIRQTPLQAQQSEQLTSYLERVSLKPTLQEPAQSLHWRRLLDYTPSQVLRSQGFCPAVRDQPCCLGKLLNLGQPWAWRKWSTRNSKY